MSASAIGDFSLTYHKNQEHPLTEIYGVASTGTIWKFLGLIDSQEYYINEVNKVSAIMILPIKALLSHI